MKGFIKNKKAGIASLLGWLPATFIEVLIVAVFLIIISLIVITGGGFWGGMILEKDTKNYGIDDLNLILNYPVDDVNLENLILKWSLTHDDELSERIKYVVEDALDDEKQFFLEIQHLENGDVLGEIEVQKSLGKFARYTTTSTFVIFLDNGKIKLELDKSNA